MNKIILLLLLSEFAIAQDTIFLINGKNIPCKIVSANNNNIKYQVDGNDSLKFLISTNKINEVRLKSGFFIGQSTLSPKHIHSYQQSNSTHFLEENIHFKQFVSLNTFGFLSNKIGINYTHFLKNKKYALFMNINARYNTNDKEFKRLPNFTSVLSGGVGLQMLNYFNADNALFIMPSLNYEYLFREVNYQKSVITPQNVHSVQYVRESKYYTAITPSLYMGGLFFFTDYIFISPMLGFGVPISIGKDKVSNTLLQLQLNVGVKIK